MKTKKKKAGRPRTLKPEHWEVINRSVNALAPKYTFGYFELGDIKNEATIIALKGFQEGWDGKRDLGKFIYTHIKNRLMTFRRDKYHRIEPPCSLCHNHQQHEHEDGLMCDRYKKWRAYTSRKEALVSGATQNLVSDDLGETVECEPEDFKTREASVQFESIEIQDLVDSKLPAGMRKDYLKFCANEPLSPVKKERLIAELRIILKDFE